MALSTAIGRPGGQENDVAHTIRTFLDQFGGSNGRLILFGCRKETKTPATMPRARDFLLFLPDEKLLGLIRR